MTTLAVPTRTICGIEELPAHGAAGVTHVLSITDPGWPDLAAFGTYGNIRRTSLQFHDEIDPRPGVVLPAPAHVEAILSFGRDMDGQAEEGVDGHLLVHCHMGISRSTAAMATLMTQAEPDAEPDAIFARLREIRPQAWPNSLMIAMADDLLNRRGGLTAALRRHYAHQIAAQPALVRMIENVGRRREIEMARSA
jgi:predicted protein tyrosine phosphatase